MAWKKMTAVGVGVAMGISSALMAMIPSPHHTEASILVTDLKNIEESVKTAIQTANILNETQKQYLLMMIENRSFDQNTLAGFFTSQDKNIAQMYYIYKQYDGVRKLGTTASEVWKTEIGDLNSVLSGDVGSVDDAKKKAEILQGWWDRTSQRAKVLENTYKDADKTVKGIEQNYKTLQESTQDIQSKSANAAGQKQAVQAGTAQEGATTAAVNNVAVGVSTLIDIETTKSYNENQENLAVDEVSKNSKAYMSLMADRIKDAQK